MFYGTTPPEVAAILKRICERKKPENVFALFAGNFVGEQIAGDACSAIIHSTDVSLYSRGIGFGLTDQVFDATYKPHIKEQFPLFGESPMEKAAAILFLTAHASNAKKADKKYYENLVKDGVRHYERYLKELIIKLEKVRKRVNGRLKFYGVDACKLIDLPKAGDVVFYDPPVIKGDYEKMFKALEECFDYTPEPYTVIDEEIVNRHLTLLNDRGVIVLYRTNNPLEESRLKNDLQNYSMVLKAGYKYNASYCVYTNRPDLIGSGLYHRYKPLTEEVVNYRMITREDEITAKSKIDIVEVKSAVSNHYRMLWVHKAQMTDAGVPYLIFIDGKLIGMVQLATAVIYGSDLICIFSDPAAPYSKYKRLSKLILNICCSRQMLKMYNQKSVWEHTGFTTRVNTNADSSMKYRGMFKLVEKKPNTDPNYKYILIYQNKDKLFPTLKAALSAWLAKDAKILNEGLNLDTEN